MTITMTMRMTIPMDDTAALARLMTWMSPSFPVGAYSYSHGLEWLVEAGTITTRDDLAGWIAELLAHGSGRMDLGLCGLAWRARRDQDRAALEELRQFGVALCPSAERELEATAQGTAFLKAAGAGWPGLVDGLDAGQAWPYPIAVGAVAAAADLSLDRTRTAFGHGFVANLVSAGVRLIPLGQTDGVKALAALEARVRAAALGPSETIEEIGGFMPLTDIASLRHETQYTRLFRS